MSGILGGGGRGGKGILLSNPTALVGHGNVYPRFDDAGLVGVVNFRDCFNLQVIRVRSTNPDGPNKLTDVLFVPHADFWYLDASNNHLPVATVDRLIKACVGCKPNGYLTLNGQTPAAPPTPCPTLEVVAPIDPVGFDGTYEAQNSYNDKPSWVNVAVDPNQGLWHDGARWVIHYMGNPFWDGPAGTDDPTGTYTPSAGSPATENATVSKSDPGDPDWPDTGEPWVWVLVDKGWTVNVDT